MDSVLEEYLLSRAAEKRAAFVKAEEYLKWRYPKLYRRAFSYEGGGVPLSGSFTSLQSASGSTYLNSKPIMRLIGKAGVPSRVEIRPQSGNVGDVVETISHEGSHVLEGLRDPARTLSEVEQLRRTQAALRKHGGANLTDLLYQAYRDTPGERRAWQIGETARKSFLRAVEKGFWDTAGKGRALKGTLKGVGATKLGLPILALLALGGYAAKRADSEEVDDTSEVS